MSGTERTTLEHEVCPKRLWVLSVLADDEVLDDLSELPRGLAFHLSRCPSCRAVADQVTRVAHGLDELGVESVPGGLLEAANQQAKAALRTGGRPTGRVRVDDEVDFAGARLQPRAGRWVVSARYAAAAAIVLAVATFGLSAFRDASGRFPGSGRAVVDHAPLSGVTPATVPADHREALDDRFATGNSGTADPNGKALLGSAAEDRLFASPTDSVGADDPFPDSFVETPLGPELDVLVPAPSAQELHRHRHSGRRGAPWCNDPRCLPTAVVLPGGARRMMQSAPAPIDRRP